VRSHIVRPVKPERAAAGMTSVSGHIGTEPAHSVMGAGDTPVGPPAMAMLRSLSRGAEAVACQEEALARLAGILDEELVCSCPAQMRVQASLPGEADAAV